MDTVDTDFATVVTCMETFTRVDIDSSSPVFNMYFSARDYFGDGGASIFVCDWLFIPMLINLERTGF